MIEQLIDELCLDNASAKQFLLAFFKWVHWLDDVVDGDVDRDPKRVATLNLEFLLTVSNNPFFAQNQAALTALIIQAMAAWVDSNEWAKREDPKDRLASDVLKGYYHEVYWYTAALCGGIEHMLAMTAKHREFDFEEDHVLSGTTVGR